MFGNVSFIRFQSQEVQGLNAKLKKNLTSLFSPAAPDGPGKPLWEFVSDVVCEDLCQPNDLPVVLHEQKSILIQALSVLQALYRCQNLWCSRNDTSKFPNISTCFNTFKPFWTDIPDRLLLFI